MEKMTPESNPQDNLNLAQTQSTESAESTQSTESIQQDFNEFKEIFPIAQVYDDYIFRIDTYPTTMEGSNGNGIKIWITPLYDNTYKIEYEAQADWQISIPKKTVSEKMSKKDVLYYLDKAQNLQKFNK
jgi:hypothetical protein